MMRRYVRRHRRLATVSLVIWGSAAIVAAGATADDANTPPVGGVEASATGDPSATQSESGAAGGGAADVAAPAEVSALRARIEAAETQIELLKSVVVQALRAQSAAEAALRREREARDAGQSAAGAPQLMLADQLETLSDNLASLRDEVAALRAENRADAPEPAPPASSSSGVTTESGPAPAAGPDDFSGAGVGGEYIPLIEDEAAAFPADDAVPVDDEKIKVAEVHFDPGSADLTPGGRRNTLEALERIKAMEAAKVRVVGYADTMGDAGYNRRLSAQRARVIAALLEQVGLSNGMVEIVGNGEDGVPEPTADGVSEPLNRYAGIFVVMDSPK
jgi:outer membrane protein OmpA-like peptidoglycan-associated protein